MKRKYRRLIPLFVLLGVSALAGLFEVFLYRGVDSYSHPPRKAAAVNPVSLLLNVNEVPFKTQDGVELHGWLIPGKPGYPALIIAHDYGSDRSATLGKLEGLVSDLNKQGYFIFLFDFRGHGESASRSSLGYRESADVEAALREVLKYRQVGRRIGVMGIGMGAVAACMASAGIDETKLVILDSIEDDIPAKFTDQFLHDWPFSHFLGPLLLKAITWNLKTSLSIGDTDLHLAQVLPKLYPRAVLFVDTTPPAESAKTLYEAAKEPKELLQLGETAADDLMGDSRQRYKDELEAKIRKYLPAETDQQTLEIGK